MPFARARATTFGPWWVRREAASAAVRPSEGCARFAVSITSDLPERQRPRALRVGSVAAARSYMQPGSPAA
jgi:hypothetical protein